MSASDSELPYLSRALKAPRITAVRERLANRARDEGWVRIPANPITHSGVFDHPRSEAAERPT